MTQTTSPTKVCTHTACFGLYFSKISSALSSPPSVKSMIILLQWALEIFIWRIQRKKRERKRTCRDLFLSWKKAQELLLLCTEEL